MGSRRVHRPTRSSGVDVDLGPVGVVHPAVSSSGAPSSAGSSGAPGAAAAGDRQSRRHRDAGCSRCSPGVVAAADGSADDADSTVRVSAGHVPRRARPSDSPSSVARVRRPRPTRARRPAVGRPDDRRRPPRRRHRPPTDTGGHRRDRAAVGRRPDPGRHHARRSCSPRAAELRARRASPSYCTPSRSTAMNRCSVRTGGGHRTDGRPVPQPGVEVGRAAPVTVNVGCPAASTVEHGLVAVLGARLLGPTPSNRPTWTHHSPPVSVVRSSRPIGPSMVTVAQGGAPPYMTSSTSVDPVGRPAPGRPGRRRRRPSASASSRCTRASCACRRSTKPTVWSCRARSTRTRRARPPPMRPEGSGRRRAEAASRLGQVGRRAGIRRPRARRRIGQPLAGRWCPRTVCTSVRCATQVGRRPVRAAGHRRSRDRSRPARRRSGSESARSCAR